MVRAATPSQKIELVPIDATIISLTSNLLWKLGYHQVKLFAGTNIDSGNIIGSLVNFGQEHDYNYRTELIDRLNNNQVGVLDRGFAGASFVNHCHEQDKYFV